MSTRERMLARIRGALGHDERPATAEEARAARLEALGDAPPQRPVWQEDDIARFRACLETAAATSVVVERLADAGQAVADYLADTPAGRHIHRAPDPALDAIAWPDSLTVETATDGRAALVGVSRAVAGVAETGSLALLSGPDNPATLAFLPDYHIIVLHTGDVVPWFEDLWSRLRGSDAFPPRSLNFITGPSRTADVEQTLQLGAHGPRSLHVILVAS